MINARERKDLIEAERLIAGPSKIRICHSGRMMKALLLTGMLWLMVLELAGCAPGEKLWEFQDR